MKTHYQKMLEEVKKASEAKRRPTMLLHSCCAPCSSAVIEKLKDVFDLTIFYYNPNILPAEEYEKRKTEQQKYLQKIGIAFVEGDYNPSEYFSAIKGLEDLGEKTQRCYECYKFRMIKTAEFAQAHKFDYFCTTLTVSPHKNADYVNEIGQKITLSKFLPSDFKKDNGYLRSIQISKENNFYRQLYCGCGLKTSE